MNLCLGSVTVSTEGSTSSNQDKTLNAREYFGLTPAYFDGKARATVKAKTHLVCLYMDKATVEKIITPIIREIERLSQSQGRSQGGCPRGPGTPLRQKIPEGGYRAEKLFARAKIFLTGGHPP
jgi:hypothetical protein